MWWRIITFCVLVSIVLFVVISCVYGRPVLHLFFHRCCEEDIENDQVLYQNFGNSFPRERLIGGDFKELDNNTLFEIENIDEIIATLREKLNVHDLQSRSFLKTIHDYENRRDELIEDHFKFTSTTEKLLYNNYTENELISETLENNKIDVEADNVEDVDNKEEEIFSLNESKPMSLNKDESESIIVKLKQTDLNDNKRNKVENELETKTTVVNKFNENISTAQFNENLSTTDYTDIVEKEREMTTRIVETSYENVENVTKSNTNNGFTRSAS